jgi:hypothetical protein
LNAIRLVVAVGGDGGGWWCWWLLGIESSGSNDVVGNNVEGEKRYKRLLTYG